MARKVLIFDTTLRDGEQAPGAKLNIEQKLAVARQLERLGVDVIEAGFPISSPGDAEAVRQVALSVREPIISGLARAVDKDIEVLWDSIKEAESPRIHIVLGASDIHLAKKLRIDREKSIQMAVDAVRFAKKLCSEVEYSTEDAARSDFEHLAKTVEAVIKAGATVVNIPDTVGYAIPEEFGALIRRIKERVPVTDRIILSVHCHNDLGLATANSLAAVYNGADQVECTVNGIGERAGNASLEEIVMALKTRKEQFNVETGIVTKEIINTSHLVSRMMNIPVQPNKAIVGANAFAHSSGIHQDGILKDRSTYEIIQPEDVGLKEHMLILTARSGRAALGHKLKAMNYDVSGEMFERIHDRFLRVADRKKEIAEEDLRSIVEIEMGKVSETFTFISLQVMSGDTALPLATVALKKGDQEIREASIGNGPIDAIFNCIDRIVGHSAKLLEYKVEALTTGKDALGEASLKVRINDEVYSGRGTSPDVLEASARAYLNAFNRYFAMP
ncbi:MAG: 2-isopropylmalate synthase [Pseudomonadota bacterium]